MQTGNNQRHQNTARQAEQLYAGADQRKGGHIHEDVGDDQRRIYEIDQTWVVDLNRRTDDNVFERQGRQQRRRCRIARNAKRQRRQHRPSNIGVVCRFGAHKRFVTAFAPLFLLFRFGPAFSDVVGKKGSNIGASTGIAPMTVPNIPERAADGTNRLNRFKGGMIRPTRLGIVGAFFDGNVRNISAIPNRPISTAT